MMRIKSGYDRNEDMCWDIDSDIKESVGQCTQ